MLSTIYNAFQSVENPFKNEWADNVSVVRRIKTKRRSVDQQQEESKSEQHEVPSW